MLGSKTIDSILKNFNKTIVDLRGIAETSEKHSDEFNSKAAELIVKADDAQKETVKATNIANKLEKLISGE